MMRKIGFLLAIMFVVQASLMSQQRAGHISFRKVDHDFRTIKEIDGPVTHVFSFVNTGSTPVTINDVKTSCGCTSPEYTRKPILPGDTGFIKVTYNPSGRPGSFIKDITIVSNADNSPQVLKITGNVIARERKPEEEFRYPMGNLRFETSHLGFGQLFYGVSKSMTLKMFNSGDTDLNISFINLPAWIKINGIKGGKVLLKSKDKMELGVEYITSKRNDWGFIIDYIYLAINGKQDPQNKITVTADIIEDFSKLTPQQRANAPSISFQKTEYNFGSVKEGNLVEYEFVFVNKGKSDLQIRKITNTCGCITATVNNKTVKPGQSGSIKVVYNTKGFKTSQQKTIAVVSNDPNASQITLWLKGIIQ